MEDQAQFLRDLVGMRKQAPESFSAGAWIIALASGRARTGKSTLARNLVSVFSRKGYRVFLQDGQDEAGLESLLAARLSRRARESGSARQSGDERDEGQPESRDLVIVDLPGDASHNAFRLFAAADESVVVALPGTPGVRDAADFINLFSRREAEPVASIRIVINCTESVAEGRNSALAVMKACVPGENSSLVEYRGCVFRHPDTDVPDSEADNTALVDSDPGSRTAISLVHLAERLERGRRSGIVADLHEYNVRIVSELDGDSGLSLL